MKVVTLVSGRGSNLEALADAIDDGSCAAMLAGVVADRPCAAIELARTRGFTTRVVHTSAYADRASWDAALADTIGELDADWVVLAGFMKIVGPAVLERFGGHILNVHPSLLPSFPGLDAPRQALDAGARIAGCTVHHVDAGVDTGPIIAQGALRVSEDDDAASLHRRIQRLEHRLLPRVLDAIARGAPPTIALLTDE